MAAGFPAKTSFTDGAVLPASDLNDLGGTINKVYNGGTYPNQLSTPRSATLCFDRYRLPPRPTRLLMRQTLLLMLALR